MNIFSLILLKLNFYLWVYLGSSNARKKVFAGHETVAGPHGGSAGPVESFVRPPTSLARPIAVG
jgi:hypothetical protein